ELMSLDLGLIAEFHEQGINVNVYNGHSLTVSFANSPRANEPDSVRAVFARRVAEYVRDHYPYGRYSELQSIRVTFNKVSQTDPLTITSTTGAYQFTPADLGAPRT